MAAMISFHRSPLSHLTATTKFVSHKVPPKCGKTSSLSDSSTRRFKTMCSSQKPSSFLPATEQRDGFSAVKKCVISVALSVGLITGAHALGWPEMASAKPIFPALPDVSVLISGPPIKDPGALLRYALPIDNKAIREVQKPLEDITESLKIASVKALDSVERNVRQASRNLKQGRTLIVQGLAKSKVDDGVELLNKLETGFEELLQIVQDKNRDAVAPKQKELLDYVGG